MAFSSAIQNWLAYREKSGWIEVVDQTILSNRRDLSSVRDNERAGEMERVLSIKYDREEETIQTMERKAKFRA